MRSKIQRVTHLHFHMNTSLPIPPDKSLGQHAILTTSDAFALFVFESQRNLDSKTIPRICRFYRQDGCRSLKDDGVVAARGQEQACAFLIRARSGDLIAISERISGNPISVWRNFRIGPDLGLIPLLSASRKLSYEEIHRMLSANAENSQSLAVEEEDIAILFSQDQPSWLRAILDAQLARWRQCEPSKYYEHTSELSNGSELQRCVALAPHVALARWKTQLSQMQLDQAIQSSPAGAVRYAIRDIPQQLRMDFLRKNPSVALQNSGELSDAELSVCSAEDPLNALHLRSEYRPKQQAIILALSYTYFLNDRTYFHLEDFQAEVAGSIREFPMEWVAVHGGSFDRLVTNLDICISYKLDAAALTVFLNNVEPSEKGAVARHIAAHI